MTLFHLSGAIQKPVGKRIIVFCGAVWYKFIKSVSGRPFADRRCDFMKRDLLKVLSCPCCLGTLKLNELQHDEENIIEGSLSCLNCKLNFNIREGVPVFGLKRDNKDDRVKEIEAENEWVFSANDFQEHIRYAKTSSQEGNEHIKYIDSFDENSPHRKNVLDIGSGWGCFQAWQFAKKGYNVTATELCPEFIFASDTVAKDCYFERVITDCTVLPFKDQSFDIIFCKDTLHHIEYPSSLLNEMWRVCSPKGLIVINEPCVSSLLKLFIAKINRAKKIGISHHFRTTGEYIKLVNDIACDPVINFKIFTEFSYLVQHMPLSDFINNLIIYLCGCNIEVFGVRKANYKSRHPTGREIIPIKIDKINFTQINFYRNELIPSIFNIFAESI